MLITPRFRKRILATWNDVVLTIHCHGEAKLVTLFLIAYEQLDIRDRSDQEEN